MYQKTFRQPLVCGQSFSSRRIGFTLIELIIVITVILALAAMGMPIWNKVRRDGEVNATRNLVQAVALAITSYERRDWAYLKPPSPNNLNTPPLTAVCNLWDLNNDRILDGDPMLSWTAAEKNTAGGSGQYGNRIYELKASGTWVYDTTAQLYSGFYDMANPTLGKQFFDKATRQICDPWRTGTQRHPLHIYYAANTYGSSSFGVYSTGPDGIDQYGVPLSDDICSWR